MTKFQMLIAELKFCAVHLIMKDGTEKVVTLYSELCHYAVPENANEQTPITTVCLKHGKDGKAEVCGKFVFLFEDIESFHAIKLDKDNFYLDSITCYD